MTERTVTGIETAAAPTRGRLAAEFVLLYVGAPLVMALALPADWMWPVLFGVTAVAAGLLARTPGFAWASSCAAGGGSTGGRCWRRGR